MMDDGRFDAFANGGGWLDLLVHIFHMDLNFGDF